MMRLAVWIFHTFFPSIEAIWYFGKGMGFWQRSQESRVRRSRNGVLVRYASANTPYWTDTAKTVH